MGIREMMETLLLIGVGVLMARLIFEILIEKKLDKINPRRR